MKGNAPTMNPVVLHARKKEKKNHDLLFYSDKEKKREREKEKLETGDQVRARGLQSAMEKEGTKKKKIRGQKHRSVR